MDFGKSIAIMPRVKRNQLKQRPAMKLRFDGIENWVVIA